MIAQTRTAYDALALTLVAGCILAELETRTDAGEGQWVAAELFWRVAYYSDRYSQRTTGLVGKDPLLRGQVQGAV